MLDILLCPHLSRFSVKSVPNFFRNPSRAVQLTHLMMLLLLWGWGRFATQNNPWAGGGSTMRRGCPWRRSRPVAMVPCVPKSRVQAFDGSSFSRKPVAQNISLWISLKRFKNFKILLNSVFQGSDCGSDGSVVASNTRGPQWESRHRQNLIINIFTVNCWRDENKEKRGREWPIFKIVPFNNTKSIGIKSLTETSSCKGNNNPSKIYIN